MNIRALLAGLLALGSIGTNWCLCAEGVPTREQLTNKLRFKIPFQFDSKELARRNAREVQLYVSLDQGRRWKRSQTVAPDAGRFQFEAEGSGTYWFSLRMVDSDGEHYPEGPHKAGLKVRIDADQPDAELELTQTSPGTVQISWNVQDEQLDLEKLILRVKGPNALDWSEPNIERVAQGEYDFKLKTSGTVTAELTAYDMAGNSTRVMRSLKSNTSSPSGAPQRPEKIALSRSQSEEDLLSMSTTFPGVGQSTRELASEQKPKVWNGPRFNDKIPTQNTSTATSLKTKKPESEPYREPVETAPSVTQIVNTLKFQLRYSLVDVVPSEVESIELFVTENGGATWRSYGFDEDRKSPMIVNVDSPGEYGMALVVRDRLGAGAIVPQDGDAPAMRIIVDQVAPSLELKSIERRVEEGRSRVEIEWNAHDEHFSAEPIALFFSENSSGPWSRIARPLPNNGRYIWQPDQELPEQLFIRIEARDRAGNLRAVESPRGYRSKSARSGTSSPNKRSVRSSD